MSEQLSILSTLTDILCKIRYFENYKNVGEFLDLDLLDNLGDAILMNEQLMFLGKDSVSNCLNLKPWAFLCTCIYSVTLALVHSSSISERERERESEPEKCCHFNPFLSLQPSIVSTTSYLREVKLKGLVSFLSLC